MTKIEDIIKIFTPQLKELGLITKPRKRLWLDDNGLFVIVVDFQPLYNEGFLLNVGVKFMWYDPKYISYDYEYEYSRILIPHSPIQEVLFYNSPTFDRDIEYMKEKLNEKIEILRQMKDSDILYDRLLNRKSSLNPTLAAVNLGVAAMLSGKENIALNIFNEFAAQSEIAAECLCNCENSETFKKYICARANRVRNEFSSIHKYPLPEIIIEQ